MAFSGFTQSLCVTYTHMLAFKVWILEALELLNLTTRAGFHPDPFICPEMTVLSRQDALLAMWHSIQEEKNPYVSMCVLTTGNSPIDQGVWCLVEDSIWCHSGTGVQHDIKSTHKETYGTGNSDEYTVMDHPRSHRRGLRSPSSPPSPFHFTLHSKMQTYVFISTLVASRCEEGKWLNREKSSVSTRLYLLNIHRF